MKRISTYLIASIIGGVSSVFPLQFLKKENEVKLSRVENYPAGQVYTVKNSGEVVPLNFKDVSKKVMDAVVHIKSSQTVHHSVRSPQYHDPFRDFFNDNFFDDFFGHRRFRVEPKQKQVPQTKVGTGSGVIVNENGYIITNNHVIDNADDIEVTLHDNRTFKATVVGTDPSTDLALIQIKEENLPIVPLINSDEIEVGEWVLAVGNPFNLNSTVTAGIVSAKGRNINILKDKSAIESFIQTDAAINPGNSGGALVNLQGGLVGINTAIASPTGSYAGYGFAVPSNIVKKVVEDLLKFGVVQRGYLGVMIRDVDGNLAEEKDLNVTEGVYVDSLMENSAAKKGGLKIGDVITHVDNKVINTVPELQELIGRHRPGDNVKIMVNRSGKEKELSVKLRNAEGNADLTNLEKDEVLRKLGAELEELEKAEAKKLNIKGGVKIKQLKQGLLKRQTKIREGFIITKLSGKNVKSKEDISEILKEHKGGVMLEGVYEKLPGKHYYAFGIDK